VPVFDADVRVFIVVERARIIAVDDGSNFPEAVALKRSPQQLGHRRLTDFSSARVTGFVAPEPLP
jgi:hypothetical protein